MNYSMYIPTFKSKFKKELSDLIKFKRANGYKYGQSYCSMLIRLDNFLNSLDNSELIINQDVVDNWMKQCKSSNKLSTKGRYFYIMNQFCEYLRSLNYDNIIKPETYGVNYKSQFIPYIFSYDEIKKMINILKNRLDKSDIDNYSFYILICLYYCCGLRRMEALNLKLDDYDKIEKTITINNSKNNTSRIIPLSQKLNTLLEEYLLLRKSSLNYIFIDKYEKKFGEGKLRRYFKKLLIEAEIPVKHDGNSQCLHELRHTFAVHSLKQMEVKGFDLYTALPILSVYLGHKNIIETEYYLRLIKQEAVDVLDKTQKYIKNLYITDEECYHE